MEENMSGNVNPVNPKKPKRILMIAANPAVSSQTGWNIGFWWSEVTHPYWAFSEVGYEVEIRSPDGGDLVADGYSDPEDASQYSASDLISLGFKHSPSHAALLKNTKSIADVKLEDYDGVFVTGGQSPMYTMIDHTALHKLLADFYEAGKITAAICHGTCTLLKATKSDGKLIVNGKTWTGFANSEEQFADQFVGKRIQPFWIEDEARKIPNTNFGVAQQFGAYAIRDGNLVTGQQQFSGAAAAELVIQALGR
jgi:putative intracellular protease/amidase